MDIIRYNKIDFHSKIITDSLGLKIDNGVRELVVVLNYIGIGTIQSCWGHKNWGHNYPWIDILGKYEGQVSTIIEGFDIEIEVFGETLRVYPKCKSLRTGRYKFNKLKNELLKQING